MYEQRYEYSVLGIVGFVLSFIFSILGIVFSCLGIQDCNKNQKLGKGVAIAGLIISIVFLIIKILIVVFATRFVINIFNIIGLSF